jgi:hypothetical protein
VSRQKVVRAESAHTKAVHRRTEAACTRHRDEVQSDMVVGSESCAPQSDDGAEAMTLLHCLQGQ